MGVDLKVDSSSRLQAISSVIAAFPFAGYMEHGRDAYDTVSGYCTSLLPTGARILDYGCGPCDKTAVLAALGYDCWGVDDLSDDWHLLGNNKDRIRAFAKSSKIHFLESGRLPPELSATSFDMVMAHDVIEHFTDSPRDFLCDLVSLLRPGGYLYLTVPNAVNLRKRLLVLFGETNYPRFPAFYWSTPTWRGHKREYVLDDLQKLYLFLGLESVVLQGDHHRMAALGSAKGLFRLTFGLFSGLRDTLTLIARKPANWTPSQLTDEERAIIYQRETGYRYKA